MKNVISCSLKSSLYMISLSSVVEKVWTSIVLVYGDLAFLPGGNICIKFVISPIYTFLYSRLYYDNLPDNEYNNILFY